MLATQMSATTLVRDNVHWPVGLAIAVGTQHGDFDFTGQVEEVPVRFLDFSPKFVAIEILQHFPTGRKASLSLQDTAQSSEARSGVAKQEKQFSALEVIKIVSKRFLGVPFMNITAHSRHIEQVICLVAAKGALLGFPA
jgi:hypothetical protein